MKASPYCAVTRDELAEFAAFILESISPVLNIREIHEGYDPERLAELLRNTGEECEAWIEHAHTHHDLAGEGEVAVDRDGLRACCYGMLHAFRAFQDRRQTCLEAEAGSTVTQMAVGLWLLLGLSDEEMDAYREGLKRRASLIAHLEQEPETDPVLIPVAPRSLTALLELIRQYNQSSEPARRQKLWSELMASARRLARYIQEREKEPSKTVPPGTVEVSAKQLMRVPGWILDGFFQSDGRGMLATEEYLDRFIQGLSQE